MKCEPLRRSCWWHTVHVSSNSLNLVHSNSAHHTVNVPDALPHSFYLRHNRPCLDRCVHLGHAHSPENRTIKSLLCSQDRGRFDNSSGKSSHSARESSELLSDYINRCSCEVRTYLAGRTPAWGAVNSSSKPKYVL